MYSAQKKRNKSATHHATPSCVFGAPVSPIKTVEPIETSFERADPCEPNTMFTLYKPSYNWLYNRLDELCKDPSQEELDRPSQDVYDATASQKGGCMDSRRRDAFDRMNIQSVSSSRL